MESKAVDAVFSDGILRPPGYKMPTSDKDMRFAIKQLVDRKRKNLSTHEACQEVAIAIQRSYEWVRGTYDSTLISERRIYDDQNR